MHYSPAAAPLQFIYPTIYSANRVFYLFILHDYAYYVQLQVLIVVLVWKQKKCCKNNKRNKNGIICKVLSY